MLIHADVVDEGFVCSECVSSLTDRSGLLASDWLSAGSHSAAAIRQLAASRSRARVLVQMQG